MLRQGGQGCWKRGVSRPIEGLDSLRAAGTLRMRRQLAGGTDASRPIAGARSIRPGLVVHHPSQPGPNHADAKRPRCRLATTKPAAFGRRRGCRGPRWAETRFCPLQDSLASGRAGRGSARSESGRRGHRSKCGRLLSAALQRCAEESCREPAESGRSGRIQAPVSRSAKPLPTLPPATNPPRDARRAAPDHSAAGTQHRHSGASGFDVNRWVSASRHLAVRTRCRSEI